MPLQAVESNTVAIGKNSGREAFVTKALYGTDVFFGTDKGGTSWIVLPSQSKQISFKSNLHGVCYLIERSPSKNYYAIVGHMGDSDASLALETINIIDGAPIVSAPQKINLLEGLSGLTADDFATGKFTIEVTDEGKTYFINGKKPNKRSQLIPGTITVLQPEKPSWFSRLATQMQPVVEANYWNIVKTYAVGGTLLGSLAGFKHSSWYAPTIGLAAGSVCGLAIAHLASKLCDTYRK